jgi:hypothetical protein
MPNAELEGMGPVVVGVLVGVWLGGVFGVWLSLKLLRRAAPAPTAALVSAAIPTWAIVSLPSFFWLLQRLSDDDIPNLVQILLPVLIVAIPPTLGSRWLVLHNEKIRANRGREENRA